MASSGNYSPGSAEPSGAVVDTKQLQVAAVYAKALLGVTENAGNTEAVLLELSALITEVLDKLPKLDAVLASALVPHENKERLLDRAFQGKALPVVLNFLRVLSLHGRLDCLRAVVRAAREQLDEMRGLVRVHVRTATALDTAGQGRLTEALKSLLGGSPVLDCTTAPNLIGGIVLRIGDTVYDGSVTAQLERLRAQMIERSVHEIQSRRDRFSSAAGN